jgi:hypothetical protein
MTPTHEAWQELVLAYEDLAPEERARADEHLAACAACRALLSRLQAIEHAPGPQGLLPSLEETEAYRLTPEEARDAAASLAAVRHRLGISGQATETAGAAARPRGFLHAVLAALTPLFSRRLAPRLLIPVLAAAALVVVVVQLLPPQLGPGVRDLQLVPAAALRGGGDTLPPGDRAWHTGEAFFLRFELTRNGCPVVFHVDPAGRVELLHPETPDAPLVGAPGGTAMQLPPMSSGAEWTFEGEPGRETFLVAVTARTRVDLANLLEEARVPARDLGDRDRAVARLRDLLAARLGPVAAVEVTHLP